MPVKAPEPKAVVYQVVILGGPLSGELRSAFETAGGSREDVKLEFAESLVPEPEPQREQIRRWVARGVDLFAIAFWDGSKTEAVIQEANALGVPVLVFGSETETFSGEVVSRIASNPYRSGQLAGMTMIEAVGESPASLGLVDFTKESLVAHRIRGIEDSLGRFARSRLEGGPTLSTTPLPLELLATEKVGGLFVFPEARLGPTAAALERVSRQAQTSVIGFGSGPAAIDALSRGRVYALIQPMPEALAEKTFSTIEAVLAEGDVADVQWVSPVAVFRHDRSESGL